MQRRVYEANLAWALALAAKPHLDAVDRNNIFAAIGAGETFEAIRKLLKFVAVKRIPVKPDLALGCRSGLHGYVGHEDERNLRRHIEDFVIPHFIQVSATEQVHLSQRHKGAVAGRAVEPLRHRSGGSLPLRRPVP
jgi:hypothetical protein